MSNFILCDFDNFKQMPIPKNKCALWNTTKFIGYIYDEILCPKTSTRGDREKLCQIAIKYYHDPSILINKFTANQIRHFDDEKLVRRCLYWRFDRVSNATLKAIRDGGRWYRWMTQELDVASDYGGAYIIGELRIVRFARLRYYFDEQSFTFRVMDYYDDDIKELEVDPCPELYDFIKNYKANYELKYHSREY